MHILNYSTYASTIPVHIFYVVSSSKIVMQPTDTSAADPFSGVFTCSVVGYGYQNITWYKQSSTLPYKYKINEMTSGEVTTSTLVIPNVTEEDVGKYYCQVWANNIGVKSNKANLYYSGTHTCIFTVECTD